MSEIGILERMQNAVNHDIAHGLLPERFDVSEDAYDQLVSELSGYGISSPQDTSTDKTPEIFGVKIVINPHYTGKMIALVSRYKNIT